MNRLREMRRGRRARRIGACAAMCCVLSSAMAQDASPSGTPAVKTDAGAARQAYLDGAKAMDRKELQTAEKAFARAVQLDPQQKEYAVALTLVREHELTALVQQAGKARLSGNPAQADALLNQARAIDPQNPLVMEHSGVAPAADAGAHKSGTDAPPMVIAGAIHLHASEAVQSFHLKGDTTDILKQVAEAYGIRAQMDTSVDHRPVRFDIDNVTFQQAMGAATQMAHVFYIALDETNMLVAKDDADHRQKLQPQLEETIYLQAQTPEQINDVAAVLRTVFGVQRASVQPTLGAIVVRAPEDTLVPMNATIQELIDSNSEIVLDVKLYETDITHGRNIGVTLPTQAGIYNVNAEATNLVNANQSLVQQAIAQGLVKSTDSNVTIALALIASGLVSSSLLSSTVGFFGHGLTLTGITETGSAGVNLALNETDTRILDVVQMRVDDRQPGTFRSGTRYPITTSTYTSGISTGASALSGVNINGVSVASLLSQFSGGSSVTIPQVSYEDLGVTLKATPTIQRSGEIYLQLDLKIEALAGGSLNGIPVLNSRQVVSNITVNGGETAMLVSNVNRTESAAVTGLPGLSELPGFQAPLDKNAEKDSGQLVVLITPHVVRRRMNPLAGPAILMKEPSGGGAAPGPPGQ